MHPYLQEYFARFIHISNEEIENFCQLFEPKIIKKKDFLLRAGDICSFEAFIIKGLFKVFHLDKNGKEQVLYFGAEDWWITDFDSFENEKPSQLYIQALEDSEILLIDKVKKQQAFEQFSFLYKLYYKMTKTTHIALQRRMIDNLSKTANERYWDFLERYPNIAKRLSNVQISGYLGVTHEFISKIRKNLNIS